MVSLAATTPPLATTAADMMDTAYDPVATPALVKPTAPTPAGAAATAHMGKKAFSFLYQIHSSAAVVSVGHFTLQISTHLIHL